jgi:hypothetical protein
MILLTPEELSLLLEEQGYEILDTFGWYDMRPFSEGERKLLLVAHKKG